MSRSSREDSLQSSHHVMDDVSIPPIVRQQDLDLNDDITLMNEGLSKNQPDLPPDSPSQPSAVDHPSLTNPGNEGDDHTPHTSESGADSGTELEAGEDHEEGHHTAVENDDDDDDLDSEGVQPDVVYGAGTNVTVDGPSGDVQPGTGDDEKGEEVDGPSGGIQPGTGDDEKGEEVDETVVSGQNVTPGSTDDEKVESYAFLNFSLLQVVENDSDQSDAFQMVPVFEQGAFVGPFAQAPTSSNLNDVSGSNYEHWYSDGPYMDRVAFQFRYLSDVKGYSIGKPEIKVRDGSTIVPSVEEYRNDPQNGIGSFTILYRCKSEGDEKSIMSFHIQITANHAIDTAWKKICGRGRFEHMEFGFTTHDHRTALFNSDGTFGTEEKKRLEIGPLETSTELTVKLVSPAQNLEFLDPFVVSDSEDVSVSLRGTVSGASFSSDVSTKFAVLYECRTTTTANIKFSVAIPPWQNVSTSWRKDCGGSRSQALLIGTGGPSSFDVMQDGELNSLYNVSAESSSDEAMRDSKIIPGNTDTMTFSVTNSDDTSDIEIQTISMTMSDPDILTTVVEPSAFGGDIRASGARVERRKSRSLRLHFFCKKAGSSVVLVTLPTLRYRNVEFGFVKECNEPKVHHHSGFLNTASSLMGAILFVAIVGGIGLWIYLRRRSEAKYRSVPASDGAVP